MIPGEYILKKEAIKFNHNKNKILIEVLNTGDRPIQIGSHYHFYEVNKYMKFDRIRTIGMRLNIPSGSTIRFEPGEEKEVELVEIGGNKIIFGFNNLIGGENISENNDTIKRKLHDFLKS